MNSKTERHDEHPVDALLLQALGDETPPEVGRRLTQGLESFAPPARRLRFPVTVGSAVAAALVVLLLLLFRGQQPLYAQVRAAMIEARTIHAVARAMRDGEWVVRAELWYDRERGVVMREYHDDGRTAWLIDDGTTRWQARGKGNVLEKFRSSSPSQWDEVDELLQPQRALTGATRDPAGDREIDGAACRLYVMRPDDKPYRTLAWIDEDNRLRRLEEHTLADGRWRDDEVVEAVYDQPVDPALFTPDIPAGARVLDRTAPLGDEFSLDKAVLVREELGLVFAVHRAVPVGEDMLLVVASLRPSERTWRDAPPHRPMNAMVHGSMQLYGRGNRDAEHRWYGVSRLELARYSGESLEVHVSLNRLSGPWQAKPDAWPMTLSLNVMGPLAELRQKAGQPLDQRLALDVPAQPVPSISLDAALREVYDEAARLTGPMPTVQLQMRPEPFTPEEVAAEVARGVPESEAKRYMHGRSADPAQITPEQFHDEVMAQLRQWQP